MASRFVVLLLFYLVAAYAPAYAATAILISLDGVHPDYLKRSRTPTLNRIAKSGVRARWMTPAFPALTFPIHYTLVTGLVPDKHGVVANNFFDPDIGVFARSDPAAVGNARWFGGEPLWVTVRKQGRVSATMFWPGSEAPIGGLYANHWRRFDYGVTEPQRVDQVLAWLDLPEAERPQLITLYFETADRAGHEFGPDSPQLLDALSTLDAQLARLLRGLKARGLRDAVNLVIVSDHGMAPLSRERLVVLDDLVDISMLEPVNMGELLLLYPHRGHEAALEAALLKQLHPHLRCHRKGELPPKWRYGASPRLPPVVCQADTGWRFVTRKWLNERRGHVGAGAHGYANDDPTMRAIFVAQGPAIARGKVVAPIDAVDVHPFLCALLELECPKGDGDAALSRAWIVR